jgi:2-polyprenyl-3-methyl-5-hydroxy-6-metoxy-1,4-benzoquinol methylase
MSADKTSPSGIKHWLHATDTHKADPSYYQRVAEALHEQVIPRLGPTSSVLDFGCGDGEYSIQLGERCRSVHGVDVSAALIGKAQRSCTSAAGHVSFSVGDRPPHDQTYDMVVCMGVLVCVLEDSAFEDILVRLARSVAAGGFLVLRETLSWNEPMLADLGDYVAHYRMPIQYLAPLARHNIVLLEDTHLATWSESEARSNHLWVLARGSS